MASKFNLDIEEVVQKNSMAFLHNLQAESEFDSNFTGDLLAFSWLDEIEAACPFIDTIVRDAKLFLIKEENVVLIEKSKRIGVSSIKDLARHTERINKYIPETEDVEPSKILDIRSEETYNIYENRFLYTVVRLLDKFIAKKEKLLKNFELKDNKLLEYKASTLTESERVKLELKIESESLPNDNINKNIKDQIREVRKRIKRIKEFLASWEHSQMIRELEAQHVAMVEPPIKKTNLILKNPNFQMAYKLWEFLYKYEFEDRESDEEDEEGKAGDVLKGFLDHSFLIDYYVMEAMATSKREQKKKMSKYAVFLLNQELERVILLLKKCGFSITDEELLKMMLKSLRNGRSERLVGADDVKKKFKSAIDEYLERIEDL